VEFGVNSGAVVNDKVSGFWTTIVIAASFPKKESPLLHHKTFACQSAFSVFH